MVNPLHAVAPVLPLEASPYLPATRRFRNPLYLRVDGTAAAGDASTATPRGRRSCAALREAFATRTDHAAFDAWRSAAGAPLEEFALWSVLATEHGGDWRAWPEPLHDPHGAGRPSRGGGTGRRGHLPRLAAVPARDPARARPPVT